MSGKKKTKLQIFFRYTIREATKKRNGELNMKKITVIITAVLMCVCMLAACGKNDVQNDGIVSPAANTAASENSSYTFTYKGKQIYIGQDASIIDSLGECKDYSESASCAFEGMDKQYFYGSFYVTTGTLDDREFVTAFWFVDDTVETDEGLCIGDSAEKVEELYGADGFNGTNAYIYDKGECELTIIMESDMVNSIQYAYAG